MHYVIGGERLFFSDASVSAVRERFVVVCVCDGVSHPSPEPLELN